jgi:hypothetical protein
VKNFVRGIRLREGANSTAEEIRDFCRGQISHYKIPRHIKFVESFPMTVTGKIQKYLMREESIKELGCRKRRLREVTLHKKSGIPRTAGRDMFKSNLQGAPNFPNPTNGSWWIVQIQPTKEISKMPQRFARSSSEFAESRDRSPRAASAPKSGGALGRT